MKAKTRILQDDITAVLHKKLTGLIVRFLKASVLSLTYDKQGDYNYYNYLHNILE